MLSIVFIISSSVRSSSSSSSVYKAYKAFVSSILLINSPILLPTQAIHAATSSSSSSAAYSIKPTPPDLVLQDISFNVQSIDNEIKMLKATFIDTCTVLREQITNNKIDNKQIISNVFAFGPDTYDASKVFFLPGVSSYFSQGGHATITYQMTKIDDKIDSNDNLIEITENGNGLQYVKVGTEYLRLSKAIENGGAIKYAYGYIDVDTPNEIPLEIVVGKTNDPIMLTCLRVSNMKESLDFFINTLGMTKYPLPLARASGSVFERAQPSKTEYVSYSDNTMGILLTETPSVNDLESKKRNKKVVIEPVVVGNKLSGFTIIANDISEMIDGSNDSDAKKRIKDLISKQMVTSPDGYKFYIKPYSTFSKEASSKTIFEWSYVYK